VPTEFVVYPRELHPVREEKHTLDLLRRVLAWYDKFVKGM
jgi:dipeptidyl aminopeptidase/acylaminoacyl peptidase